MSTLFLQCLADAGYTVRPYMGCVGVEMPSRTTPWEIAIAVYEVAARMSAAACDAVYETASPWIEEVDGHCIAYWPGLAWPAEGTPT